MFVIDPNPVKRRMERVSIVPLRHLVITFLI